MTLTLLIIGVIMVLAAGWLRAAGTAVGQIPRADAVRAASDGRQGAVVVAELMEEREAIAPAVGMVGTALLVTGAVLVTVGLTMSGSSASMLLIGLVVAVAVFLLGDLLPRLIGRARPVPIAYSSGGMVRVAMQIGGSARELLPEVEGEEVGENGAPDEGDDEQERELIDSVLEFGETVVREVMTPRPDMVMVPVTASIDELVAVTSEAGYSRVPVISQGDVVGVVIVKDLLPLLSEGQRPTVAELMRPADFIPESKLAAALLAEMQESHSHLMIVVDEYGEVAGLVTIEDLLEELVGEIADETDEEEEFITARGAGAWDVDARLSVEDLAEAAGVELPDGDWDTVGGLILGLAERVPEEGEVFNYGGISLTVTRMQGRRISEVRVTAGESVETG